VLVSATIIADGRSIGWSELLTSGPRMFGECDVSNPAQ